MSPPASETELQALRTLRPVGYWFVAVASMVVLATGSLVAATWVAISPGAGLWRDRLVTMMPNTALCFVALGAGLLLLLARRARPAAAFAVIVLLTALATAAEYALAVDLRIDTLLFEALAPGSALAGARMTPVTSILFIVAAVAVIVAASPRADRFASIVGAAASAIGGISLAALIGYATQTPGAYVWGARAPVAIHTAGAFVLIGLSLGTLAASWSPHYLPRWLPFAALLSGLACTLALSTALFVELDSQYQSLAPEISAAVGCALSAAAALALHSQRRLGQQRLRLESAYAEQSKLLEQRARLAAIVESANDAIISVDLTNRIVVWNGAAERLLGYAAGEVLGRQLDIIVPDEDLPIAVATVAKARAGAGTQGLRTHRRHKDGTLIEIDLDVSPVRNVDGAIIGTAGIVRDIAARLEYERMIQGVLEAAPDAMVITDPAGAIVLVNSMTEKLFGYPREELVGQSVECLVPERARTSHPTRRDDFMAGPSRRTMGAGRDLHARRRNGSEFPAEIALNRLTLPNRTLIVAAVRDMTARLAAEQRLKESLAEKELLLKEIHHRVKNNLQVVASMLTLQAEQFQNPLLRAPLELCRQRVMSLALVHEKLYAAQDLRRIDLSQLVREIATMLVSGEPAGRVTTRFALHPTIVDIETAFPASLLVNELITNALKHAFAFRDQGRLEIDVRPVSNDRIALIVADDGPGGLTKERLDIATSLGSTIIRNLVRQLDAQIHIDNDGGCAVTVIFPARASADP